MLHFIHFITVEDGGSVVPGTIQLGTPGTTTSSSFGFAPFSFAYDYSFASWIVKASELSAIGGAAQIDSIELYLGSMSDATYLMNNQKIYVGNTSLNDWTNNLPDVDHSESGSTVTNRITCKSSFSKTYLAAEVGTWITFTFNTPFQWDGTSNIVFDWENKDGSYNFGGAKFDIQVLSGSVAYDRQDSSYPAGEGCNLDDERPIMKINYS